MHILFVTFIVELNLVAAVCTFQTECTRSILLATGWTVRGLNPGGDEIFRTRQTGPEAYPTSYTMGTGYFPGVKAAGAWS
jgi:hypothetical protein